LSYFKRDIEQIEKIQTPETFSKGLFGTNMSSYDERPKQLVLQEWRAARTPLVFSYIVVLGLISANFHDFKFNPTYSKSRVQFLALA